MAPAARYPFPTTLPYPPAEIPKLFGVVTVEQDPDPAIHYKLVMPLQWGQVPGKRQLVTPAHPFELRSHFKALTGPAAEIKVYIALVEQELAPADWLAIYLARQGEEVLHEAHFAQEGGTQSDVLTLAESETTTTQAGRISRWVVLKDWAKTGGSHMFLLQASTHALDYGPEMAKIFYMATSQFDLLHPSDWRYAEQLRTLVRAVPARISTVFPVSWQQRENPLSDEHFYQVKLTKELKGRSIGLLNLIVLAGQTEADLRRVEEETRLAYQEEHLDFAPADFAPAPAFGAFQQVYAAHTAQTNAGEGPAQERQVLLARAGTYWVYLENVRLTQQTAPEEWAISKRAFEIVQQHLVVKP